jgi:hypothetical protein
MTPPEKLGTTRLKEHDYSSPGTYHLQFDTCDGAPALCEQGNSGSTLTACGEILLSVILMALQRFPCLSLRSMNILPHCLVLVLVLVIEQRRISLWGLLAKTYSDLRKRRIMTIPLFAGYVKMNSARRINQYCGNRSGSVWTRRYKDRVMTDEVEINSFCAELDASFSRIEVQQAEIVNTGEALELATALSVVFGGMNIDEPTRRVMLRSPIQEFATMLLSRAFFPFLLFIGYENAE